MTNPHSTPNASKAAGHEILRCVVGSKVLGLSVDGTDDLDLMGICLEPPEYVVGLRPFEQWISRTRADGTPQAEGARSGPGDTDLVVYSARKWARLALSGNPTVLLPLFVPPEHVMVQTEAGESLRRLSFAFASRRAGNAFLGYMTQQRERMTGVRGGKHTNRPELIEKYGYDCYLDDTEFLTSRGWRFYDDIGDDDRLATVAKDGRLEFQLPLDRVAKPYTGEMVTATGAGGGWAVTPNHRMLVSPVQRGGGGLAGYGYRQEVADWQFRRADELGERGFWHVRVSPVPRQTTNIGAQDEYLVLIGAYVSEGCVTKRAAEAPSVLAFEQKDGGRLFPIMEIIGRRWPLRTYHYDRPVTKWTLADREVAAEVVRQCGETSHYKHLPAWITSLTERQARLLLDALLAGDGTPHRSGGWVYYTVSRRLADDVQTLGLVAGMRATVWGPYAPAAMYQVRLQDGPSVVALSRRQLQRFDVEDARIVCFTVPNETLVTRRGGQVAMHGNTKYAYHMLRLGMQGVEFMQTGRITLPIPEPARTFLLEVRTGGVPMAQVLDTANAYEAEVKRLLTDSPLPAQPNAAAVEAWLLAAYAAAWEW